MHHRLIHTSKNGRLHSRQLFHDMFTGGFSHMDKESKQPGIVAYVTMYTILYSFKTIEKQLKK